MEGPYRMVVAGELVDAASGQTFASIDPSTGQAFATVAKGGRPDADAAVAAARRAFDEGPWPRMRGRERAQHLLRVVDLVKQHGRELAALEARDSGGTIRKCSSADIGMIINTFRFFAELAARESDEEPLPWTSSP